MHDAAHFRVKPGDAIDNSAFCGSDARHQQRDWGIAMILPQLSALGWFHTLGSLPAVPLSLWLLATHGRIPPATRLGKLWLLFMFTGALSGVLVVKSPPGAAIAALSVISLTVGSLVGLVRPLASQRWWIETSALSVATFTLFLPSVTETLTRLPAGKPLAASPEAPLVVAFQLAILLLLIAGLTYQLTVMRPRLKAAVAG
jgi:hypothetical protein